MQPHSNSSRTSRRQAQGRHLVLTLILSTLLLGVAAVPCAASTLLLDLPFSEGSGAQTANVGIYGDIGLFDPGISGVGGFPQFSANVPAGPWAPAGNAASVDFGLIASDEGGRAIDFPPSAAAGLGDAIPASGLLRFTLAGWINLHSTEVGPGGNRILSTWPNGSTGTLGTARQRGIDLVVVSNSTVSTTGARLRLGVNAAPDQDVQGPFSSNGKALVGQWVFFAVTYNNGQVAYYFGDGNTPAALDVTATYNRQGVVNSGLPVTVGNFQPGGGNGTIRYALGASSRALRGLADELKVYATALSLAQVQTVQTNGTIPTTLPAFVVEPVNRSVFNGQDATFTARATGTPPLSYQWQRGNVDIPGETGANYTLAGATLADNGAQFRVVVNDAVGTLFSTNATSTNATLTVSSDTTPPTVVLVETTRNLTTLRVTFSKFVDAATAENSANYVLTFGAVPLTTVSAVLQPNQTNVLLTTDAMTPGALHTIKIMNVRDLALPPNTMSPFELVFTAYNPPPRTTPWIEVRFEEGVGGAVTNSGAVGGTGTIDSGLGSSAAGLPKFTNNIPLGPYAPSGNLWSLYTGTGTGHAQYAGKAVDFPYAVKSSTVGHEQFTVCGWINVTDGTIGSGGNRIIGTWPNNAASLNANQLTGFDVVVTANGTLRLGVNQAPDYPTPPGNIGPTSSTGKVTTSAGADPGNWVFFAITYDTALGSENVQFYFGNGNTQATKDTAATLVNYNRGAIADASLQRDLTLANFVSGTPSEGTLRDSTSASRAFRGLMDEIRFFAAALTLEEIQQVQTAGGAVVTAPAGILTQPANQTVFAGQPAAFSIAVTGTPPIAVQWQRDASNIPDATDFSYTLFPGVTDNGAVFRAAVSNQFGTNLSLGATLTVRPEDGHKARLPLNEAAGIVTANLGNLGGNGTFTLQAGFPVFSNAFPVGPQAPAGNVSSVDFGAIIAPEDGNRSIDFTNAWGNTLGRMEALTVCGWLNCRDLTVGFGGNRIAFALDDANGRGFDLVHLADGSLRLGVNQWPDGAEGGGPISSIGKITADANGGPDNWVFFAVTYDPALADGHAKFYFGGPAFPAELDVPRDYNRGPLVVTGPLTLGNFGATAGGARTATGPAGAGSRVFRGLMDEISVFNRALTLDETRLVQKGLPLVVTGPTLSIVREGSQAVITWTSATTFELVYKNSLVAGNWTPVTETVVTVGDLHTVRVNTDQPTRYYRLQE